MRCLVVFAHPVEASFAAALDAAVRTTLEAAGHEVRGRDLYAMGFEPVLSRQERLDYHTAGENERAVAEHTADLRWAEALIFVYPTWWYGLPAILKGWLDRVWVPGVTFTMPEGNRPIGPLLTHIRVVGGISTYGSPWWWVRWVGDSGRRTILRGLGALCARDRRSFWLAHYKMDASTPASRAAFLARVQHTVATL
jgi:NAD(P)H dehydrogenase (quinone)